MEGLTAHSRGLLEQLRLNAARPLGAALSLPPELYNSEEILALEFDRIFTKEWVCPGLAAEIPNPGDYLTYSIGRQSVFTIRDRDGTIRTFSNVCLHRMMELLEGTGNVRKVVCPYHAWTYGLDGHLIGAGQMHKTESFDRKDLCLPEIRTEIWNGWIYITLNSDAPSVAQSLSSLDHLIRPYDGGSFVPVIRQDHIWDTNWKLLSENFIEGYHAPYVHKQTVGQGYTHERTFFPDETHDAFSYQLFEKGEGAKMGIAHPANQRLEGRWRYTSVLPIVYPSHLFSQAPDYLWYLSLRPHGPGQVKVRIGVALAPEVYDEIPDKEAYIRPLEKFFDQANGEDRVVVEGIYRGSLSPLAAGGPLSWLERQIYDFMGYLARRLAPAVA